MVRCECSQKRKPLCFSCYSQSVQQASVLLQRAISAPHGSLFTQLNATLTRRLATALPCLHTPDVKEGLTGSSSAQLDKLGLRTVTMINSPGLCLTIPSEKGRLLVIFSQFVQRQRLT
ncbi:hypothetical protein MHYP_G00343960 [Metynnis hypsauchen]